MSLIENNIQDGLSKRIYEFRKKFLVDGKISDLDGMLHVCWDALKEKDEILKLNCRFEQLNTEMIYIFGCGNYTRLVLYLYPQFDWCVIESNQLNNNCWEGRPVIHYAEFATFFSNEKIVIASKKYYQEMFQQLCDVNVPEENIIDATFLFDLIEGQQYFDVESLELRQDEIFVDGGCFDGITSLNFINWCNGSYKHIYCFEPDNENLIKVKKNIKTEKITIVNKGLWDKETRLKFISSGSGMSKIVEDNNNQEMDESVLVTSLDIQLENIPVTFIKLDVEGSELKVLEGASKLIKKYKPKLAICVYHKLEDIDVIPQYILSIHPDYQLYFRHYGFTESETVMYAL